MPAEIMVPIGWGPVETTTTEVFADLSPEVVVGHG